MRKARQKKKVNEQHVVELIKRERCQMPKLSVRKLHVLLKDELKDNGIEIGRDLLFDIAKKHDLLIKKKRSYKRTTYSRHGLRTYPNLLKAAVLNGANQAWVSDITYVRTCEGFVYLALITDRYSRKIVGYDLSLIHI